MRYQGVRIRLLAQIIDNLILAASFGLIHFGIFGTWIRHTPGNAFLPFTTDAVCLSLLAVYFIYFMVMEATVGATVGKLVCKIRVRREDGSKCGIREAFIRNVLRIIDGLVIYLVGIILIITSGKKQRLGDMVAKTIVMKLPYPPLKDI